MNSRDLLVSTLNHQQNAKVPMDFGATAVTGMHISCISDLRDYYGLPKQPVKMSDPYQYLGLIEEDLAQAIGIDVAGVATRNTMFGFENKNWKEYRLDSGLEVLVAEDFVTTKDADGTTYIYPEGDTSAPPSGKCPKNGFYFDAIIRQEEFDEDNPNVEDNLEEFRAFTDEDIAYYRRELTAARASGRAVMCNFGGTALGDIAAVPATFMKRPKGIRDITEWYMSIACRPEFMMELFDRQTDIAIENLKRANQEFGDLVDTIYICGTDFGTQNGTFCSNETFESIYLPYYKKVNDWIHENTAWKTFKHSCGAVFNMIPLFIKAGFDILNPVQCSAAGMDPQELKNKYGNDITFWGGGIDTQFLLPFGKPDQVREQVLERCEIFSKNGGFVFSSIHNVQCKTPVENIVAMIDAVKEFNGQ